MALTQVAASYHIDGVSDVAVTDIVLDPDSGNYVREFKFFGAPDEVTGTPPTLLTVRVEGATHAAIEITTPPLNV